MGAGGVAGCSSNAPGFGRAGQVSPRGLLTAQGCGQRSARCAQERAHWVAVTLSAPAANNNHGEEEGREEQEKKIKQVLYKYEARSSPRRPCTRRTAVAPLGDDRTEARRAPVNRPRSRSWPAARQGLGPGGWLRNPRLSPTTLISHAGFHLQS